MRRIIPLAAVLLAAALSAPAEDPPKETQKESEDRFDEFIRQWRSVGAHMEDGFTRSFRIESTGDVVAAKGTMTVIARNPQPDTVFYERTVEMENREELAQRGIQLPPLLAARQWLEPPPLLFPAGGRTTLEKDVELKVGEKTLKCWKLTILADPEGPTRGLSMTFWISADEWMGLVKADLSSGNGKTFTVTLTSWSSAGK